MALPGEIEKKFTDLAERYRMDPALLKKISFMSQLGLSQIEIASRLDIHKNTVLRYVTILNAMPEPLAKKIAKWSIAIISVAAFIDWLLKQPSHKAKKYNEPVKHL